MIIREKIPLLCIKTIPSFKYIYAEEIKNFEKSDWWSLDSAEMNYYISLSSFSAHFVELFINSPLQDEIFKCFELIEKLLLEGDEYVKNAVNIGVLENIQRIALQKNIPLSSFNSYLYAESINSWNYLINFWKKRKGLKKVIYRESNDTTLLTTRVILSSFSILSMIMLSSTIKEHYHAHSLDRTIITNDHL